MAKENGYIPDWGRKMVVVVVGGGGGGGKECRTQHASQHAMTSEVQNKMIIMGHQILSCHIPVVRSIFIL